MGVQDPGGRGGRAGVVVVARRVGAVGGLGELGDAVVRGGDAGGVFAGRGVLSGGRGGAWCVVGVGSGGMFMLLLAGILETVSSGIEISSLYLLCCRGSVHW